MLFEKKIFPETVTQSPHPIFKKLYTGQINKVYADFLLNLHDTSSNSFC